MADKDHLSDEASLPCVPNFYMEEKRPSWAFLRKKIQAFTKIS